MQGRCRRQSAADSPEERSKPPWPASTGSSTDPRPAAELSTKVEYRPILVENLVDWPPRSAYLPTSALLLRPVDG
jgi:hypothetical protein